MIDFLIKIYISLANDDLKGVDLHKQQYYNLTNKRIICMQRKTKNLLYTQNR